MESTDATDHLLVDFERVVSYDTSVSDDSQATDLFATKEAAADLPEPVVSATSHRHRVRVPVGLRQSGSPSGPSGHSSADAASADAVSAGTADADAESAAALQPRLLDGLGDEAFLDDALTTAGSTAQQRTVTVVFRTSNVIVTIEYVEQPTAPETVPDSKEMQDRAQNLASQLAGAFD